MAVSGLVKTLQNIMRSDAGINGDAQRIEQMVWLLFLKVYDAQEEEWELDAEDAGTTYESIIPEVLRWRNWAPHLDDEGKERNNVLTGAELLDFIDNRLFPVLKGKDVRFEVQLKDDEIAHNIANNVRDKDNNIVCTQTITLKGIKVTKDTERCKAIVQDVFMEVNQYMKNGTLLRQMINAINDIDLYDDAEAHAFGDMYETILKDLQAAGNAGEFYTPRALTDFIIKMLNPQLGEKVGDFAMGTGGFLVSALAHLREQLGSDASNFEVFQNSIIGQEWKPFPYLLAVTNLMLHGIKNPELYHMDSLGMPMSTYQTKGKVKVIAMNPPYGGSTDAGAKLNFKADFRSSETADLFIALIMQRLDRNGRAGVIIPDGFLFGTDGAKMAIKEALLREFNLHTIIRLPGSIFAPYTSIATNVIFFNNERAEDAPEGYKTRETWIYRMDMPEGYKNFSKTKPMKMEHTQPIQDWWHDRKEIVQDYDDEDAPQIGDKARCFSVKELVDGGFNFDLCKFPKEEKEVLPPDELLRKYHEKRTALDMKIDQTLTEIKDILGINL